MISRLNFCSCRVKTVIVFFLLIFGGFILSKLRERTLDLRTTKGEINMVIKNRCSSSDVLTDQNLRYSCKFLIEAKNSNLFLADQLEMDNFEKIKFTKSPAPCGSVQLLILINSAAKNKEKRRAIRSTWKPVLEKIGNMSIFFVTGETMDNTITKELHAEADLYSDVILLQLLDEYRRISIKHVMMYKWMRDFCDSAIYLIKCDDDVILNPFAYKFMQEEFMGNRTMNLFGHRLSRKSPIRAGWKWSMPTSFYPFILYPNYINGPGVFQSRTATLKMLEVLPFIPIFGIDDVYIGGLASALAGVKPVGHASFQSRFPKNPKQQSTVFAWISGDAKRIEYEWRALQQLTSNYTKKP